MLPILPDMVKMDNIIFPHYGSVQIKNEMTLEKHFLFVGRRVGLKIERFCLIQFFGYLYKSKVAVESKLLGNRSSLTSCPYYANYRINSKPCEVG